MSIKTMICDDNENAIYIIREYLKKLSIQEIQIVGEYNSGYSLIEACKRNPVDLILLDVDMPFLNGIEASKKIINFLPDISFIFITAYPNFAISAFEVHAVDYIVKPISIERFEKSLLYIVDKKNKKNHVSDNKYIQVSSDRDLYSIKHNDILFAERTGRKTIIHTHHNKLETYESLDGLQSKLPSNNFLRSHNSYLINVEHITKISKRFAGSHEILFKNYENPAYISRRNIGKLDNVSKNIKLWPVIHINLPITTSKFIYIK